MRETRPPDQQRKQKGNREKGFYLNFTNASFTSTLRISGRTHTTCSCSHNLANFHKQNPVILIGIHVIGNFGRGWMISPSHISQRIQLRRVEQQKKPFGLNVTSVCERFFMHCYTIDNIFATEMLLMHAPLGTTLTIHIFIWYDD